MTYWHHGPIHRLGQTGAYIVSTGVYRKDHVLRDPDDRTYVLGELFAFAKAFGWQLQAWAVMSNHYHFVAISSRNPENLSEMLNQFHSVTAIELNRRQGTAGRKVWHQFRDTRLTYLRSYHARLRYVNENPVRHRIARSAANYRWCSAAWFERTAPAAFRREIESYAIDRVNVPDEYEPV